MVNCKACLKRMVVLLNEATETLTPHLYVFGCPWCGRLTSRKLQGVLLRVERADEEQSDNC